MMSKQIIIFIGVVTFVNAGIYAVGENKNRYPNVTVENVHRKIGSRYYPEFFTSFARSDKHYQESFFDGADRAIERVPFIGHYQNPETKARGQTIGDEYNARVRIGLIEHNGTALARVIPQTVRNALLKAGIADLSSVEFSTNIIGYFAHKNQLPFGTETNTCNIAFHPVIRRWRGSGVRDFNENPRVGVFEARGISARGGGIAFNTLAPLNTYYHDGYAFSPNNGRFSYDPAGAISTFWIVCVYEGRANVTFNIMANQNTEELLLPVTERENFNGVIDTLHNIALILNSVEFEADVRTLQMTLADFRRSGAASHSGFLGAPSHKADEALVDWRTVGLHEAVALAAERRAHEKRSDVRSKVVSEIDPVVLQYMEEAFKLHIDQNRVKDAQELYSEIRAANSGVAARCQTYANKNGYRLR